MLKGGQLNGTSSMSSGASSNGGPANGSVSNSSAWRSETLHNQSTIPAAQEVDPSFYEELKLGHDGAGFKRLK